MAVDPLKTSPGELLRCSGQSPLEARSLQLVQFVVQHRDFLGAHAIVNQVRSSQSRRLSQCFDLPINQLVNFTFDGGGWVSHHTVPPREL